MTEYNKEELKMLNQVLFALFLVADFALFLHITNNEFPWFALLGSGIGLSIIVICWTEKKVTYFIGSLLAFTIVFSIIYNWHTLIS
ncbi:hypothetical protein [Bacillus sp. FJAT-22090]|uniref:hypothetical protein n=1 Tax=Bacillus sp. FJAT-22090 TaxID=1581038 RepID=UPI0011A5462A|nr:hypothetical protein [Bacillus sp. FJAT-22090]